MMDKQKPAAERVRSILQAMEQSIDAARQRRTMGNRPAIAMPDAVLPLERSYLDTPPAADASQRLRARPKRSTPLTGYDDRSPLRPGN